MQIFSKINFENIFTFLHEIRSSILKSEVFKIGLAVFVAIALTLFLLPYAFNNSSLKFQIEQKVSEMLGVSFVINGEVRVALLPSPKIIAEDVVLQNYKVKSVKTDSKKDVDGDEKIYNLYAKEVHIELPTFSISHNSFAKKLTFVDAILESYHGINQAAVRKDNFTVAIAQFTKNHAIISDDASDSELSAKLFSLDDVKASNLNIDNIPELVIKNGEILFYDKLDRLQDVKSISAKVKISSEKISVAGDFTSSDINSDFSFLAKFNSTSKRPQSYLKVDSSIMKLRVKGNFTSSNIGILESDFNGKIDMEISELKSFYKSYISDSSVFFHKLKHSAVPIKISADVDTKDHDISITNLLINSSLANGKGEINLSFAEKAPLADMTFDLENLDLDSIWSGDEVSVAAPDIAQNVEPSATPDSVNNSNPALTQNSALPDSEAPTPKPDDQMMDKTAIIPAEESSVKDAMNQIAADNLTPSPAEDPVKKISPIDFKLTSDIKDFDVTAEIKIKSVKYLESEIKDVDIYATVSKESEILFLPITMKIPGDGALRITGVLDNSAALPKFVGKFDVQGKLLSDVIKWFKIESKNLKFDNFKAYKASSDILLLPNSVAMNNFYLNLNNGQSEFRGEAKIDTANKISTLSNHLHITNFNVDDYFFTSWNSSYLSPGLLLKKLLWLNDVSLNSMMDLSFDQLSYNNQNFSNQTMQLNFGHGYFSIANLYLKSDEIDAKADFLIDISDKDPRFEINIDGDNFYYRADRKDQVIADANNEKDSAKKIQKQNFVDQFFDLPSLKGFNGKVAFNFKNLQLDNLKLQNAKLIGKLEDGVVDISNLGFDVCGGALNYKGSVVVKQSKVLNGNFSFNNVDLQQLLYNLFGINAVSGIANISASVTGAGERKADFMQMLNSEIKFSANAPSVDNYGLNDLVKKMFQPQVYGSELVDPEKIIFNNTAKTVFKQAEGTIQINGGKDVRLRINTSAQVLNGILSGKANITDNTIDTLFSVIFLTGNRQKQTPINIATSLKGDMSSISQNTNLDQVKQYLGLIKPTSVTPLPADPNQLPAQGSAQPSQALPQNEALPNQAPNQDKSRIVNQPNQAAPQ